MSRAAEILGPDGPLASSMSGYEPREGQLAMARSVEATLAHDGVLLCEAGTGTGKTLAYLVPAIQSGRRVVISTATRALQEQIFFKDIPLIERFLGLQAEAALMKGLSNYLCRRRYAEFLATEESLRPRYAQPLKSLATWIGDTEFGDRSELVGIPEQDPIWPEVTSSSDTRVGAKCQYYGECFVTRMRREAEAARIIVVNHHLFFADLALRGAHPGRVLPDYDAVIFDEAHQLEDVATNFFGVRVTSARVARVLADAERAFRTLGQLDSLLTDERRAAHLDSVRVRAERLFEAACGESRAFDARVTLGSDVWSGQQLRGAWLELDGALEGLVAAASVCSGRLARPEDNSVAFAPGADSGALADILDVVARRGQGIRDDLRVIAESDDSRITWVERTRRGGALSSAPVDLGSIFRERVFARVPAVVVTSATLSSRSSESSLAEDARIEKSVFPFLRARLGLTEDEPPVAELCLASPFDFQKNAMLYTPDDLPDPREGHFLLSATARLEQLIELTDGGAFVLTTSLRAMRLLHTALRSVVGNRPLLLQGEAPKSQTLARFKALGNAVLVATMSFWEGVDVPGRALRLVVLEKIPFPVPTDPIISARSRAIEEAGGSSFAELHLPIARISLKQGFGRLIRNSRDRGVVALLDARILRKGYGPSLLRGLPPARRATRFEQVVEFWEQKS